jgi:hypothetical protein
LLDGLHTPAVGVCSSVWRQQDTDVASGTVGGQSEKPLPFSHATY